MFLDVLDGLQSILATLVHTYNVVVYFMFVLTGNCGNVMRMI